MLEMLEFILDKKILFVLLGVMTIIGVISKLVVNVVLKRLVYAASNMSKSNHSLMRLLRAKFEHACMVSDRVGNVRVFVDKYLYEYKVIGLRLHTWRRLEKAAAGMCLLIGGAGAALAYSVYGMHEVVLRIGATGAVLAILIYLFHLTTDEGYRLDAAQNYMVDYLENVCLHKYEKSPQKELKVMAPEVPIADFGVVSEKAIQEEEEQLRTKEKEQQKEMEQLKQAEDKLFAKEENVFAKEEKPQQIPVKQLEPRVVVPNVKQAAAKEEKEVQKPKEEPKKDILIRQILEEFMA